jgi:hypothetical protein
MTICVSVKVSEGLVLAADSTASIQGWIGEPQKGPPSILKTYDHVRKLSHIKDYPIGTLTWGAALIGARSVESLIKEYEYSLQSLEGNENDYTVQEIASGLLVHVKNFYDAEFASQPLAARSPLGILVSGYSRKKFFPEQLLINLPVSDKLDAVRPDKDGKPEFGAHWFGLTDAIIRLHFGRDDAALGILAEHFKVTPDEVFQLLLKLQYPVIFDGMPLQDAIDYAVYLVNVVIGRFRFVVGAPLCSGEIDVAVITPSEFTWIQRKCWHVTRALVK